MNIFTPTRRTYIRVAATLLSLVFITIVIPQLLTTRAAATFTVNSPLDTPDVTPGDGTCADVNGLCTLRAAIQEANSFSGDDTINFSVNGTIDLTGTLVLSSNMNINGPGSGLLTVRRNTGGNYRILETSGNSSISGLTITNGRTPDATTEDVAPPGGGLLQTDGELSLRDVVITGNATGNGGPTRLSEPSRGGNGGAGGGIYGNGGALTMTDCVVSNNTTGNGGTGSSFAGSGGRGGGIFFAPGNLTLNNVVVSGNHTGDSGGPIGGSSGDGGGIVSGDLSSGRFTVADLKKVTITNNSTGSGGNAGNSGSGGGIYVNQGLLNLTDSTVSNNHTGNTNPAEFLRTAGSGGGILNNAQLIAMNSLISGNTTGSSSPSSHSTGGGISNLADLTLINTTVSGNSTGSGASMGGGIFTDATVRVSNCTITKNISPNGNGITGQHGSYVVANTIIAGNGASANGPDLKNNLNSELFYISRGNNLIGNADGVSDFNNTGDQTGSTATPLDPKLGPLANNGGPTLTHALLPNSTALDAGDNNWAATPGGAFLPTDQRGAQRFADSPDADSTATVDIGAFEFQQTLEDIPNKIINEDTALTVTFGLGDNGPGVTSVTATSNNQALLPNANLVLGGTGAARSLQLTPPANQFGVATITVTVNLVGGGTLSDTFTVTVIPINDAPSFSIPSTHTVLEDAGPRTIANFATNVTAGPLESAQTITFTTTLSSNLGLFSVAPSVSSNGTLTYTPAPNQYGEALVSLVLKDDGGTDGGGVDTSSVKTFTISVLPVNDAPTFTKGANQTVAEDSFFQFVGDWATNISQGPNEFDAFNFQVTNNTNPGLFIAQPVVNFGGLTYTPAADANGSADITIVLKDTGGTANGGVDTSVPQTFTITVTPVNDAPRITLQSSLVRVNGQIPLVFKAANFNRIGLSDDSGTDPIRVTLTATQGTLTLPSTAGLTFVTGDGADDETMTFRGLADTIDSRLSGLTFKPKNNVEGNANLQIVADDEGHNGAGGAQTSSANVIILVDAIGPVLLTEEHTDRAIALDLVTQTRDPFSVTNPFNLSNDHARRVSLFVWNLALLPPIDTVASVLVVAQDDEDRFYVLPVEALATVVDVTQVVVRLPDNVIGAPRDLRVTVSLRGLRTNEAVIKIQ